MFISDEVLPSDTKTVAGDRSTIRVGPPPHAQQWTELLGQGFGCRFTLLDGLTGDVLHPADDQPGCDWGVRSELIREVARRGSSEFLDDEDPLIVLAVPFEDAQGNSTVAAAVFLTRGVEPDEDLSKATERLGMNAEQAVRWATRQTPWSPNTLYRVSELVLLQSRSQQRIEKLKYENDSLSVHIDDAEFGTVEASLLSSVAAILGIHSGNIELYRQQSELFEGIVRALTSAIDAKDPCTCGHSDRVARVAVRLAEELGCDTQTMDTMYLAGLLHDVGKIGIDDSVLRKPGKLSDEEYEHIKRHSEIGHRILRDLSKLDSVLPVVLHHHESWDGSGYPEKLIAERIPLSARIVAVADAFDAMGSDRPYRKGMPDEKIDDIFRTGAGRQWDPNVVDAFFYVRDDIRKIART